ncbi:TMV resistance protein N-like [Camellia sinensis]|uniref:TMV resistance protein N-like n=1 Tax=Camellia sinensis TaxID=4442 RepID=UPI001035B788|nr:TMV resistance protein N-like [Camellia sinensis]
MGLRGLQLSHTGWYKQIISKAPRRNFPKRWSALCLFPKLLLAKFGCRIWVSHVEFSLATLKMKKKTRGTPSNNIYIYISGGWSCCYLVLPISVGVVAAVTLSKLGIQSFALAVANPVWLKHIDELVAAMGSGKTQFESKFIHKIVEVVADKLKCKILGNSPYLIGIHSRAKNIGLWLQDECSDVGIVTICGIGGIGKTTIAKFLYNSNFSRFECSSFLANVREILKQPNGLLQLQTQLLSDILKGRKENLYSVDEGIVKITHALCCKRVLVILDDVDTMDQLDAVLGMRDWFSQGSKIIITTRRVRLLRAHEVYQVHNVENLNYNESLELFSWHAFGKNCPIDGFIEDSKRVVQYCGGLPLAIKILGSSLSGKSLIVWKSHLEKLKAIPNYEVVEKLKISYDSLQDDHDKNLFLHVACFFVGMDEDWVVTILDGCDFYTTVGIQNLIDRCLLTVDERRQLVMHQLVQEMGREIVRQESPKELGERSRLWNHKDSFNVLRENTVRINPTTHLYLYVFVQLFIIKT